MMTKARYELAFNWASTRETIFTQELARAAKHHRIRWLSVLKGQAERVRRRVDRGALRVGLFLNTQADGTNFESPAMLLCRSLKANGAIVVEDPDDAQVYANRGLLYGYLHKAGLAVPKYFVIKDWRTGKRVMTAAQLAQLGKPWMARPAVGLDRKPVLVSSAKFIFATLARSGFNRGQELLLSKHYTPASWGDRELRFVVWYLMGQIVPCWFRQGAHTPEIMGPADLDFELLPHLLNSVGCIAKLTGLDWFASEFVVSKVGGKLQPMIIEPANALAGFGPGVRALSSMPAEIMRIAAQRIVDIAWRHAQRLPLSYGTSICLAPR